MVRLKKEISLNKKIIVIIILIFFITLILLNTIVKKASNNMLYISKRIVNVANTNIVNNNIRMDLLKKYKMNDLIEIVYVKDEVKSVDFNLESAYNILIEIKKKIIDEIDENMNNLYNYNYSITNNIVNIEMPFYNYTNNLLLSNLGPKINVNISMVKLVDGKVSTKITNYGINSLLVELYVNIIITSSVLLPSINEESFTNNYDILITSKVIQGEIPSYYNGLLEQSSKNISL